MIPVIVCRKENGGFDNYIDAYAAAEANVSPYSVTVFRIGPGSMGALEKAATLNRSQVNGLKIADSTVIKCRCTTCPNSSGCPLKKS